MSRVFVCRRYLKTFGQPPTDWSLDFGPTRLPVLPGPFRLDISRTLGSREDGGYVPGWGKGVLRGPNHDSPTPVLAVVPVICPRHSRLYGSPLRHTRSGPEVPPRPSQERPDSLVLLSVTVGPGGPSLVQGQTVDRSFYSSVVRGGSNNL